MQVTDKHRRPGRALALGASALLVAGAPAAALAAGFSGATAPLQTDTVGKNHVAQVKVDCPSSATTSCSGTVTLRTSKPLASTGKVAGLGHGKFSNVAPGKVGKANISLNSEGKKLVSAGKVSPNAIVKSHDSSGQNVIKTSTITLKKKHSGSSNPSPSPLY